eukprot:gb/GECG01009214.1/.p1 GENE.gb/GECG01009214.1/~~gb/GECG01009214.1/.p1  ORF type:complete len:691 (+),score=98.95 gb/GECG01009214.1/:1-2073(+)
MLGIAFCVDDVQKGPKLAFRYPPLLVSLGVEEEETAQQQYKEEKQQGGPRRNSGNQAHSPSTSSSAVTTTASGSSHTSSGGSATNSGDVAASSTSGQAAAQSAQGSNNASNSSASAAGSSQATSVAAGSSSPTQSSSHPNSNNTSSGTNTNSGTVGSGNTAPSKQIGQSDSIQMILRSGDQFANMFRPKNALCTGSVLELRVDDVVFISCPTLLQSKERFNRETSDASTRSPERSESSHSHTDASDGDVSLSRKGSSQTTESQVSMFNLIVVAHTSSFRSRTNRQDDTFEKEWIESVVNRFSNALSLQEKRCKYISQQAKILTELREKWVHDGKGVDPDELLRDSIDQSTLAGELIQFFYTLSSHRPTYIRLGGSSSVSIPPPTRAVESKFPEEGIRPYHAVLLYYGVRETETLLPSDCNDSLRHLVRQVSPYVSIPSMRSSLGVSQKALSSMIEHLVKWGLARVTTVLSEDSVLRVAKNEDTHQEWTSQYGDLAERFQRRFKNHELGGFLTLFDGKKPLRELTSAFYTKAECEEFLSMVAWAMSHGLIVQIQRYIQFVPPDTLWIYTDNYSQSWKATGKMVLDATEGTSASGTGMSSRDHMIRNALKAYIDNLLEQKLPADTVHQSPTESRHEFAHSLSSSLMEKIHLFNGKTPVEYICQSCGFTNEEVELLCEILPEILVKLEHGEND